jgi:hypothetical protein
MSRGDSVSSMCYVMSLKSLSKKYISLSNFNSDDVVMSRGNQNFYLRLFVKGGTLHVTSFFFCIVDCVGLAAPE